MDKESSRDLTKTSNDCAELHFPAVNLSDEGLGVVLLLLFRMRARYGRRHTCFVLPFTWPVQRNFHALIPRQSCNEKSVIAEGYPTVLGGCSREDATKATQNAFCSKCPCGKYTSSLLYEDRHPHLHDLYPLFVTSFHIQFRLRGHSFIVFVAKCHKTYTSQVCFDFTTCTSCKE